MSAAAETAADEPMPAIADTGHLQNAGAEALMARLMPQWRAAADRTDRRTVHLTVPRMPRHRMAEDRIAVVKLRIAAVADRMAAMNTISR